MHDLMSLTAGMPSPGSTGGCRAVCKWGDIRSGDQGKKGLEAKEEYEK